MPKSADLEPKNQDRTAFFNAFHDDRKEGARFLLKIANGEHPQVTNDKIQEKWAKIMDRIDQLSVPAGEQVLRDFSALLRGDVQGLEPGLTLLQAEALVFVAEAPDPPAE